MLDYFGKLNKNVIDQIKYRGTVLTGEITKDNGDGTYAVKISQAEKALPNIGTAFYDESFVVGEIVVITFEDGSKERPRIWGHAKKIAQNPVEEEVDYSGSGGSPVTTVTTLDAYSITETTSYLEGRIILSGGTGKCSRRGFKYGLTTAYGLDVHTDGNYGEGPFALQISGLIAETTYHFQAYVLDASNNEQVGEDKMIITGVSTPTRRIYVVWDDGSPSYNSYIRSYDSDGNYLDNWSIEATENIGNALAVDANNNIYTITSNQHSIKKRNLSGTLILTKTESNYIYNIVIGPDGYIYTQEYDAGWNAKIVKRNTSDLAMIDTLSLGNTNTYYGMVIDSDSNFFLINGSTHHYEKWTWAGGKIASYATTHYNLSSLGVAGSTLANIHWLNHGIYLPKTLDSVEIDVELEDMASPGAAGSVYGEYFLFSGYNSDNDVVVGKYNVMLTKVWVVVVASSANYGSICSYPF